MRSWGKQGFLNDPDSSDSGWYKFSVRPSSKKDEIGYSYLFYLADCHGRIELDFWTVKSPKQDDGNYRKSDLEATRKDVKKRLKKVRILRKVVVEAMDKFEEALLETDAKAIEALEQLKHATIDV